MTTHAARHASLFDRLTDGVCLTSRGRIEYLNAAAERLLAAPLEKVRGDSLCQLLCERLSTPGRTDCAARCALRAPSGKVKAVTFDGHYQRRMFEGVEPDGGHGEKALDLRVRCTKTGFDAESSSADTHLTVIEDVSARECLEKEREDWRNMIAHDLRSPLSNIYSALRLLQDSAKNGDAKGPHDAEILDIGVGNCRRMVKLLDLYLDVSKLAAGCMNAEIEELDFSELLKRAVADQSAMTQTRRIDLCVAVPPGLKVLADEELLSRVVQNLINNALKFTPEGGRVSLSASAHGRGAVQFEVADTGVGIARKEFPHLFDRYHQAQARRDGKVKGTGLGLAFCRQAMTAMKGDIRMQSKLGIGSRFILRLPAPPRHRRA